MNRIRIVQVVEATIAGVKRHVLSLVKGLDRDQFDITVVCPPVRHRAYGDTSFVTELRVLGVSVITVDLKHGLHPPTDMAAILRLRRLFLETDVHLVHAHSTKAGLLVRPAARLAGPSAVVYSPHAFAFCGTTNPVVRSLIIGVERALARWTDALVCVSESERDQALNARLVPAIKLTVVPNGIALAAFQEVSRVQARRRLGIERGVPVVGFVGRLEPQKGLPYLLAAVAALTQNRPALRCLIIGDGSLRPSLVNQARQLGIEGQVRFLGYRADVSALLPAFDLFVLPSLYEGLPYTVLEAMAARVPVVATDVVGTRDLIRDGETGLLVRPYESSALVAAMQMLFDNCELAEKLAHNGYEMVKQNFRLEDSIRCMEHLYLDLVNSGRFPLHGR